MDSYDGGEYGSGVARSGRGRACAIGVAGLDWNGDNALTLGDATTLWFQWLSRRVAGMTYSPFGIVFGPEMT